MKKINMFNEIEDFREESYKRNERLGKYYRYLFAYLAAMLLLSVFFFFLDKEMHTVIYVGMGAASMGILTAVIGIKRNS